MRKIDEHFEEDGALVYGAACQFGCEGIVSKRLGSPYRSGRSPGFPALDQKPEADGDHARGVLSRKLAVKREAEDDWGR